MSETRPLRRRRLLAGLAPIALALGASTLLAPTCGDPGEGFKTFSRNSLIIPMDVCYQSQTDGTGTAYAPAACPQAKDAGDVIRAYGLVYQLIRNDIAVYWVIDNTKAQIPGIDLTVQYGGGFPVLFYDWSPENPPPASPPTAGHAIDYRGGPFVVDGSDYERASQVLQQFRSTFQNVNVHVSNVAFRAYAKRTMAGGWSAGGTVAPKVALLDIGSTSNPASSTNGYAKNSEPIIRGYLARAGLDFAGAGGVATDAGHGQIYDRLGIADLQPSTPGGSWTTTNLHKYGYQILWVPHWFAPGSCSNASSQSACFGSLYPVAQREQAVKTVGAFVAAGKDLFAECAGLGSFEGVASGASAWTAEYSDGDATTHLHATNGLAINKAVAAADYDEGSASSPLLQLGDYPFVPRTGAIQNFKPATGRSPASTYTALPPAADGVRRFVTDATDGTWDYFTYRPPTPGVRGTTVYLGGHVYSGYSDTLNADGSLRTDAATFQIGGTRLVLNTLFNLGAACTASGVACNTGQLGVCAQGTIQCQGTPAVPVCAQTHTAAPQELCNGLDDNCNGEVDEGLEVECYDGPGATRDVGACRAGIRSCVQLGSGVFGMSACTGQVLPSDEVCNALDDDCDGAADESLTQGCYEGPSASIDPATGQPRPVCAAGTQTCSLGSWGACQGQVLPRPEICSEGPGSEADDDCDGTANDGCQCTTGQTRSCYTGAAGSVFGGASACKQGVQACNAGQWGACAECAAGIQPGDPGYAACQITPRPEVCGNGVDEDCDGTAPVCPGCTAPSAPIGGTTACAGFASADFPAALRNTGQCSDGAMTCSADSAWGACLGATLPSTIEACDNVDNDCDGAVDEQAVCPSRFTCLAGVCVPAACGVEMPVPEGYACNPPPSQGGTGDTDGTVLQGDCGGSGPCPAGEACRYGQCVTACTDADGDGESDQCGAGAACAGGTCVAGGCYATGCDAGELCVEGACVADPCAGALCPSGTFCREGDCVQACTFVTCFEGEKCGTDGFCEADPCAGVTCDPGQRCNGGACAANPCSDKGCAAGQTCTISGGEAVCVDDPCAGIRCPAGVCAAGQCFATANPTGAGTVSRGEAEGGCGCGSGSAAALPALLALALAPLARRRRRGARGGGLALLLVAIALVGTACKEEDPFDPATCLETCGEQRCVDLASDPSHCGGCGAEFACNEGEVCVDATCGPATAVAPYVRALSRSSGPRGSVLPVTVQLSGDRFAQGASVRMVSGSTTRTFETAFTSASALSVDLDLSDAAATTWQLRVVNPDKVISNAVAFDVVVPFPTVSSLTPDVLTAGATAEVVAAGTNLTATSQCRLRSVPNGVPDTSLPSTVDAAGVRCTVPGTLPPGTYELWVVNEGNLASNVRQLQIASSTATLQAVSPSSGAENAIASLTVTGTGFDAASRVLFDGCAGPNDPAGCPPDAPIVGTTLVNATTLVAGLLLPDCGATSCGHAVSVRSGAGANTGALPFTVAADQASISTFSPATAYQGDGCAQAGCVPVTLRFQGTSFGTPTAIQVQPPGGTFGSVPVTMTTSGSTTLAEGTVSLVGQPEGAWLARLTFGGQSSAAWPFRVLSNQAILRDVAAAPLPERSGAAGTTKTSVTCQVANLRPPYAAVRVLLRGPGGFERELVPSPAPTTATSPLTIPSVSLANLETGTYAFTVKNPNGATESNALSFSVTPGLPTLSSVSPTSHSYASANPVVTVTLTGTNFAKPDANGSGGSVVHIASPENGIADFAVPAARTTVVSRTELRVSLDVREGLPGAYDLQVWNPSLPTSVPATPQKSNVLADGFTIAP